jgi:hypothetical protein
MLPNNVCGGENEVNGKQSERGWKCRERLSAAIRVGDRVREQATAAFKEPPQLRLLLGRRYGSQDVRCIFGSQLKLVKRRRESIGVKRWHRTVRMLSIQLRNPIGVRIPKSQPKEIVECEQSNEELQNSRNLEWSIAGWFETVGRREQL